MRQCPGNRVPKPLLPVTLAHPTDVDLIPKLPGFTLSLESGESVVYPKHILGSEKLVLGTLSYSWFWVHYLTPYCSTGHGDFRPDELYFNAAFSLLHPPLVFF